MLPCDGFSFIAMCDFLRPSFSVRFPVWKFVLTFHNANQRKQLHSDNNTTGTSTLLSATRFLCSSANYPCTCREYTNVFYTNDSVHSLHTASREAAGSTNLQCVLAYMRFI